MSKRGKSSGKELFHTDDPNFVERVQQLLIDEDEGSDELSEDISDDESDPHFQPNSEEMSDSDSSDIESDTDSDSNDEIERDRMEIFEELGLERGDSRPSEQEVEVQATQSEGVQDGAGGHGRAVAHGLSEATGIMEETEQDAGAQTIALADRPNTS
ncbi:hypothetical protein GE061_017821 [Apolygus lucorum]|uniref:Uncharacterized protein n=1 Tax=Apolygus lucorum TaxID=248454 RepID=A0A8S9XC40_APOLU|nr:hypothetical protein GE061_017821 [Apolygus lucorum]